jgi:hypothetical protein
MSKPDCYGRKPGVGWLCAICPLANTCAREWLRSAGVPVNLFAVSELQLEPGPNHRRFAPILGPKR